MKNSILQLKSKPKLLVDENVAGLARWLRFLGFDSEIVQGIADTEVAAHALDDDRILISRDRELVAAMPARQAIWISTDDLRTQLKSVLSALGTTPETDWFRLCSRCNTILNEIASEEVQALSVVPGFVKLRDPRAWRCSTCQRVYWKGSHYARVEQTLREVASELVTDS